VQEINYYLKDGIFVQTARLAVSTPENVDFNKHSSPNALHWQMQEIDTTVETKK